MFKTKAYAAASKEKPLTPFEFERRDVGPSTSNQWLLWYEKPQRAGSS